MEEHLPVLSIDYSIVFQIFNFFLLYYFFKKYFFKKISEVLDARNKQIEGVIGEAQRENKRARELRLEVEKEMSNAHKEARNILEESALNAAEIKEKIMKEADKNKREIIESGREELQEMEKRIKKELKDYTMDIGVKIAEKIINEKGPKEEEKLLKDIGDKL